MTSSRHLALDFDGVIADSLSECLVTAANAYACFLGRDRSSLSPDQLPPELAEGFRRMRPLIRRGEDYVFLLQALDEGMALADQHQLDAYLQLNADRRDRYRKLFYSERARLQEANLQSWLSLSPVYPAMKPFLQGLVDPGSTCIVTTKDLASVRLVLDQHHIAIPDRNLFQATRSLRKPAILDRIVEERGLQPAQLHFVDDHVATVLEVHRDAGVTCHCAEWGYSTTQQLEALAAHGVRSLSLDAFLEEFAALTGPSSP